MKRPKRNLESPRLTSSTTPQQARPASKFSMGGASSSRRKRNVTVRLSELVQVLDVERIVYFVEDDLFCLIV